MSAGLLGSFDPGEHDNEKVLRACRGCLATDTELHDIYQKGCAQVFGEFVGLPVYPADGYPQTVCSICLFLLHKYYRFRKQCLAAMWTLQQMRAHSEIINTETIKLKQKIYITHNFGNTDVKIIDVVTENDDEVLLSELLRKEDKPKELHTEEYTSVQKDAKTRKKSAKRKKSNAKEDRNLEVEVVVVKQENDESNDSINFDYDNEEVFDDDIQDVKEDDQIQDIKEEERVTEKKATKRKVKGTRSKLKKRRKLPKEKEKEVIDEEESINEVWETIIKEIKEENMNNKPLKRKMPTKLDINLQIKKAMKFSDAYNVEVKFLTKGEQRREIEEKRTSEEFKKAPYKCVICCKILKAHTYKTHAVVHKPTSGEFECEICRYRYKSRPRYQEHFYKMHAKRISCVECGLIIRNWTSAKQHYLWHRGENNNHTCVQCNKNFSHRRNYLRHLQNKHEGGGGPQCLLCDRAFINDSGLKSHLDRAHKNNPRCSSCNAVFAGTDSLTAHLNAADGCQEGHSSCPKCGESFTSETEMKTHYDDEHRKNYYKCEQCNRAFKDLKKYTTHINYHNWKEYPEKRQGAAEASNKRWGPPRNGVYNNAKEPNEKGNFVCEICGIEKKYLATLRYHQRIHTGEKPYQCHICHKTFRQQATLQSHITIHTGERRYKCPICQKAFRQMQHRTAHLLTHTKERPYACTACPKRYTGASALKDHVNTAHLGLPPRKWGKKKELTDFQ